MGALLSLRSDKHSLETNIFVDFESKPSETRKKKNRPCSDSLWPPIAFWVILIDAKPTEGEVDLYELIQQSITQATQILEQIKAYTGCGSQIAKVCCLLFTRRHSVWPQCVFCLTTLPLCVQRTQAISKPGKENEEEAWNAVVPQVEILKTFYEYSLSLGMSCSSRACI